MARKSYTYIESNKTVIESARMGMPSQKRVRVRQHSALSTPPTSHSYSSSSGLYRSMVTSVSGVISLIPDGSYMMISHGSGTSSSRVSASTVSRILTFAQFSSPAEAQNQSLTPNYATTTLL